MRGSHRPAAVAAANWKPVVFAAAAGTISAMGTACLARTIESVEPSSLLVLKLEAPPENQHPPCQPKAPDFSQTKKIIPYPGRNQLHGFPTGGIPSTERGQKGRRFRPPATPNPDSLIRQITTLRIPHTYTHTLEIQEKFRLQIPGEFGEVLLRPPVLTTRASAALAQGLGTCDKRESSAGGVRESACSGPGAATDTRMGDLES